MFLQTDFKTEWALSANWLFFHSAIFFFPSLSYYKDMPSTENSTIHAVSSRRKKTLYIHILALWTTLATKDNIWLIFAEDDVPSLSY